MTPQGCLHDTTLTAATAFPRCQEQSPVLQGPALMKDRVLYRETRLNSHFSYNPKAKASLSNKCISSMNGPCPEELQSI